MVAATCCEILYKTKKSAIVAKYKTKVQLQQNAKQKSAIILKAVMQNDVTKMSLSNCSIKTKSNEE